MYTRTQICPVEPPADCDALTLIEYIIKENEVITGKPGCVFEIIGPESSKCRITWQSHLFGIERLDGGNHPNDVRYLPPAEFAAHDIIEALARGQLYSHSILVSDWPANSREDFMNESNHWRTP
jgi:hypothetical protein